MKKKAAIELSVNFLVIIIISIIVLGLGFALVRNSVNLGDDSINQLNKDLENRIETLLTDSAAPVAIPIVEKEIPRTERAQFGIGVLNLDGSQTEGTQEFHVGVWKNAFLDEDGNLNENTDTFSGVEVMASFDLANDGNPGKDIAFQKNAKYVVPIKTTENAKSGTYIFNVCVCKGNEDSYCKSAPDCKADNKQYLYSEQIYKIYVKVP